MRLHRWAWIALGAAALMGSAARADFTIDSFVTAGFSAITNGGINPKINPTVFNVTAGSDIVGQEREIDIRRTAGRRGVQADAGAGVGGTFGFSQDILTTGNTTLTYDGTGNGSGVTTTGLGGVDLTVGGTNLQFVLVNATSDLGGTVLVTVYDFLGGSSVSGTLLIPASNGVLADVGKYFNTFAGFGANPTIFSHVGAITINVSAPQSGDVQFDLIVTRAIPEPGSLGLLGLGILGAGFAAHQRRKLTA